MGPRPGGVSNQASIPEAPSLGSLGPIFQSVEKYCKNNLRGGGGWSPDWGADGAILMLLSLTDFQGADDTIDVFFWYQCVVELESTDVIGWDVCSSQGLGDLGHNPTLIKSQGLASDPHHLPQLSRRACEQQITRKPLLGLHVHHQGDVALDEGEGEEAYVATVITGSHGVLHSVGVEHDIHEECGNSGQRIRVQAGDTEPVAWAGQWVDDWPLDHLGLHKAIGDAEVVSGHSLPIDNPQDSELR